MSGAALRMLRTEAISGVIEAARTGQLTRKRAAALRRILDIAEPFHVREREAAAAVASGLDPLTPAALAEWRRSRGITHRQLAAALCLPLRTVEQWGAGRYPMPRYLALALAGIDAGYRLNSN